VEIAALLKLRLFSGYVSSAGMIENGILVERISAELTSARACRLRVFRLQIDISPNHSAYIFRAGM
jgi:hypothetical protein